MIPEAATVFPWDVNGDEKPEAVYHVFAGSGSRTQKGKVRPDRDVLFGLQINEEAVMAGKPDAFPATVEYNRTLRAQIRALGSEHPSEPWGRILRDSLWKAGQQPDQQNPALAGGAADGFNIEGLSVSKDGRSLLLGLRSPLVEGRALLIPLTNPVAALGLGESAPQPAALGAAGPRRSGNSEYRMGCCAGDLPHYCRSRRGGEEFPVLFVVRRKGSGTPVH